MGRVGVGAGKGRGVAAAKMVSRRKPFVGVDGDVPRSEVGTDDAEAEAEAKKGLEGHMAGVSGQRSRTTCPSYSGCHRECDGPVCLSDSERAVPLGKARSMLCFPEYCITTYKRNHSIHRIPSLIDHSHHGPGFCQVRLLSLANASMK